jgi:hypothetical protein
MRRHKDKNKLANKRQVHPYDTIKTSVKKHSEWLVKNKSTETQLLQTRLSEQRALLAAGPACIRDRRHTECEISILQGRIKDLEQDINIEEFVEQVNPLLSTTLDTNTKITQQRNALFVNLFHSTNSVPSFLDQETCHSCQGALLVSSVDSMAICGTCGVSSMFLHCPTDYTEQDSVKTIEYERAPLYRRYLMQFHEDAENPSYDILSIVYNELANVHMMMSVKVKPTPVTQIMRKHARHKWAHMAQRLCKFINAETVPVFSNDLINRLIGRFNKVSEAFLETIKQNRKKIMNFEYLTRQFLLMEGKEAEAECFDSHKSRAVVNKSDQILATCCKHITSTNQASPGESWSL